MSNPQNSLRFRMTNVILYKNKNDNDLIVSNVIFATFVFVAHLKGITVVCFGRRYLLAFH